MSAADTFEGEVEAKPTGLRWLVPMDFSVQAKAALDWVLSVMKPEDYLIVLNVLNLKAPTYTHDIVRNEVMKRESSEKLEEIAKRISDMGFRFYETSCNVVCNCAIEKKIDTIVMGRRGISNVDRLLNGSCSSYVLSNAPCAVCLMGKGVGDRIKEEELKKKNQEIAELSASLSEGEPEGAKMPFFLPRKHSVKNYYEDSDFCV
ncbi:uncharacterized protein [Blastocystis hominis]|uniref:UspA domain-containing protein n=1 Tax=Blastocystis hominis TaxID=12968 RepID=D8LW30_BLAHO|nr:uncharacterized protein [Blastocystis hominis]CBK20019.2 unnamed protein product [Blastocystis hominis]|eukprot:XP_012894067.1 uncharacterized protein [Blastocystis hominis]